MCKMPENMQAYVPQSRQAVFVRCCLKERSAGMKFSQHIFAFLMGFFIYSLIEISGRGYTHWTMGVCGGVILLLMNCITSRRNITLLRCCLIGSIIITCTEFAAGIADNLIMGWAVWDYSDMPLNILGQICLPFSALWFVLGVPMYYLCRRIQHRFRSPGLSGP
jgi:hypothetical protein